MAWVVGLTGFGLPEQRGAWSSTCELSGDLHTRRWVAEILARNGRAATSTSAWMLADDPAAHTHADITAAGVRIGHRPPSSDQGVPIMRAWK